MKMGLCKICGSSKKVERWNKIVPLCSRHYTQKSRYGHILERTIKDKNEIICQGSYCEIILYDRYCKEKARVKIDSSDADRVSKFKWGLSGNGYAVHHFW